MLSVKDIVVHYGGVQALKGVSIEAAEGTITCLIGANGAGKSTTLRAISGIAPITSGRITFQGRRIDGLDPEEIVDMGIGHVPEGKKLFLEMSVRDNLLTGAYLRKDKKETESDLKRVCGYFPVLDRAINRPAAQMSGGEQQMLAIARGLMSAPRLLLLDEPSLGLSPLLTREVGTIIRQIAKEGVTILLIEQNASLALQLAKFCYVMETGKVVLKGSGEELRRNEHVKAAYLGLDLSAPEPSALAPADRPGEEPAPRYEDLAPAWSEQTPVETTVPGRHPEPRTEPVGNGRTVLDTGGGRPWPDWDNGSPSKMERPAAGPMKEDEAEPAPPPVGPSAPGIAYRPVIKRIIKPKVDR